MLSLSINQKGATPTIPKKSNILSGYTLPAQTSQTSNPLTGAGQTSTIRQTLGTSPGLINQTPKPTTPVKSTTSPDGTKVEYHAPDTKAPDDPSNKFNTATGQPNPNYKDPNAPQTSTQQQNQQVNPQTGVNANNSTTSGIYTPPNQGTTGISQGGLIGNLAQKSQNASPEYLAAVNRYNQVAEDLKNLRTEMAKQTSDINQSGTWTSRAMGEQGQANIQNAAREQALSSELASLSNVIGQANTQQGLQVQAGTAATTANAPILRGYSSTLASPATGQDIGAGAGGAFQGGQNVGAYSAGQTSAGLHTAYGASQSVGNNLTNLIQTNNINPTDPQFTNSINQFLQTGVMSNPKYQQFYGTVNDYIASLAPILGVGGNQTDQKTSMASQMVSQLASGKSIVDTIKYFDALAADKINAFDKAGGGNFGTVSPSTNQNIVSAGGYNFKQDANGTWIPA